MRKTSPSPEEQFRFVLSLDRSLPDPVEQYVFCATRKWRSDFAWPSARVAVEVDGGQHLADGGRHNQDSDREKLNAYAALGWRVLRFTPLMLRQESYCLGVLRQALGIDQFSRETGDGLQRSVALPVAVKLRLPARKRAAKASSEGKRVLQLLEQRGIGRDTLAWRMVARQYGVGEKQTKTLP